MKSRSLEEKKLIASRPCKNILASTVGSRSKLAEELRNDE